MPDVPHGDDRVTWAIEAGFEGVVAPRRREGLGQDATIAAGAVELGVQEIGTLS
ncbi:MAG: hypothetical protein U0992_11820 [Planctomycetaceae bacterium]